MASCERYEIEIAAAGGGELAADVEAHLAGCASCARQRAAAQALAGASRGAHRIGPGAAVAMARDALAGRGTRGALWVAPLLSASASAAALILYFGLAAAPAEATATSPAERAAPTLAPALDEASEPELPDSLQALRELILAGEPVDGREADKS
jgi:hypothetical protein